MYTYVYIYINKSLSIYVYIYIYIYIRGASYEVPDFFYWALLLIVHT